MEAGQSEEASSYSQDKATLTALQKTIDKLEVWAARTAYDTCTIYICKCAVNYLYSRL